MIRRLRLGNLRKLFRDRYGPTLPNDDAGREDLMELLLPISLGPHATIQMPNAIEVWAPWMQPGETGAIIDQINLMPIWERKPDARKLGERLGVTNGQRERLRLWTIAPCDMISNEMLWWRKIKKRERMRRLRQTRGQQSRAKYLAKHTTSKERPWIALGISRASWYRLRETSPCQVKLTKAEHQPVSPHNRQVSKKESADKKPALPNTEITLQAEKPKMSVTNTARELLGPTCPIADAVIEEPAFSIGHNAGPPLDEQDLRGMPQDMSWYYKLRAACAWKATGRIDLCP
jgi:hypothetical protein